MTTIPFPNPAAAMTPAESLLLICERLPERFRLAEPVTAFEQGARRTSRPVTLAHLEVNMGPGWTQGGVYLQDGTPDIHEDELAPMAFQAVASYCFDKKLWFTLSQAPDRHWTKACMATIGSADSVAAHAQASSPAAAALLALAGHLQARRT